MRETRAHQWTKGFHPKTLAGEAKATLWKKVLALRPGSFATGGTGQVSRWLAFWDARAGTPELLGKVERFPFVPTEVSALKDQVVVLLEVQGVRLEKGPDDRDDIPIDHRFLHLLLNAALDLPQMTHELLDSGTPRVTQSVRCASATESCPSSAVVQRRQSTCPCRGRSTSGGQPDASALAPTCWSSL